MLRALLCRVVLIAALAGARSPKRAKTAGSAAPRLRGTAPHLLYAQRPPPASSEEALVTPCPLTPGLSYQSSCQVTKEMSLSGGELQHRFALSAHGILQRVCIIRPK